MSTNTIPVAQVIRAQPEDVPIEVVHAAPPPVIEPPHEEEEVVVAEEEEDAQGEAADYEPAIPGEDMEQVEAIEANEQESVWTPANLALSTRFKAFLSSTPEGKRELRNMRVVIREVGTRIRSEAQGIGDADCTPLFFVIEHWKV